MSNGYSHPRFSESTLSPDGFKSIGFSAKSGGDFNLFNMSLCYESVFSVQLLTILWVYGSLPKKISNSWWL